MPEEKILDPTGKIFDTIIQQLLTARNQYKAAIAKADASRRRCQHLVDSFGDAVRETPNDRQFVGMKDAGKAIMLAILDAVKENDVKALEKIKFSAAGLAGQSQRMDGQLSGLSEKLLQYDRCFESLEASVSEGRKAVKQYADIISAVQKLCVDNTKPWTEVILELKNGGVNVSQFFLDEAQSV